MKAESIESQLLYVEQGIVVWDRGCLQLPPQYLGIFVKGHSLVVMVKVYLVLTLCCRIVHTGGIETTPNFYEKKT